MNLRFESLKKTWFKLIFLLICIMGFTASIPAHAQWEMEFFTPNNQPMPNLLNCDTLYAVDQGGLGRRSNGRLYAVQTASAGLNPLYTFESLKPGSDPEFKSFYPQTTTTIALGRHPVTKKLTMYHWAWNGLGRTGSSNTYNRIVGYVEGEVEAFTSGFIPGISTPGAESFPGGEVNQKTGEIYLSGWGSKKISTRAYTMRRMMPGSLSTSGVMTFNPGSIVDSGQLVPATQADADLLKDYYAESDMAIDANGNIYLVGRGSGTNKYLIKVVPTMETGNWVYSAVSEIKNIPGGEKYGVAFLNGVLYIASSSTLYAVNPMTGEGRTIGTFQSSFTERTSTNETLSNRSSIFDLASCQTAPVIEGTVFHDEAGLGQGGYSKTLEGIDVELWKGSSYQSTVKTNGSGEFSFIVDSTNADFYVRFPKLEINGQRAVQTWAQAGTFLGYDGGANNVTSYCLSPSMTMEARNSSGACLSNISDGPAGSGASIDTWGSYQKISVRTDSAVSEVSIAISTAANFGDAPSSYGTPSHAAPGVSGNSAVNEMLNIVRLGDTISNQAGPIPSNDAAKITTHDGVEVAVAGTNNFVPLQNMVFVSGVEYEFKVSVQGPGAGNSYLNAWMDWSNGNVTGSFGSANQIAKNLKINSGNDITFRYTVSSNTPAGVKPTFARFRISPTQDLTPVEQSTREKTIYGEVEDYRVYVVPGDLSISTVTQGAVGTFAYTMTNISAEAPSQNSAEITVLREDEETFSGSRHVFSNVGQPITITQYSPGANAAPFQLLAASCTVNGRDIQGITIENGGKDTNKITIPGSYVQGSAQIACKFVNSAGPQVELKKLLVDRDQQGDQFTVQIKEGSTVLEPAKGANPTTSGTDKAATATTGKLTLEHNKTYTLTEIMAGGDDSRLNRYDSSISCVYNSQSSNTAVPSGEGKSFDITPKNGDDIVCTITNTPIKVSTEYSLISADPEEILADGKTTSRITVKLFKDNGKEITVGGDKVEILFTSSDHQGHFVGEDANIHTLEAHDNNDGTYYVDVASKSVGKDEFSYRVNTDKGSMTTSVGYVFGEPSEERSKITANPDAIGADGQQISTLIVELFDKDGNKITSSKDDQGNLYDIEIIYHDLSSKVGKSILSTTSSPNDNGTFEATVSSEEIGTDTFTFTIKGNKATGTEDDAKATVTYTSGAPSTVHSKITADPKEILADGSVESTLTVQLYDEKGNIIQSGEDPDTNVEYQVKVVYVDSTNNTDTKKVLSGTSYHEDGAFIATITSKTAGEDEFTFEIDSQVADSSNPDGKTTVKYTAGTADSHSSQINIEPDRIVADGSTPATITVTLYDKNNNPLTSGTDLNGDEYEVIVFSKAAQQGQGLGELSDVAGKAHNNGDGTYTITVTSTKKGREEFGFKINNGVESDNTDYVTYLVGDFDPGNSTIIASPNPIEADGKAVSVVTVQLKDANENDLEGNPGKVYIMGVNLAEQAPDDPAEGLRANYSGEGGRYTFELSSRKAGTEPEISFRFVDANDVSMPGQRTTELTYLAGDVNPGASIISVNPRSIIADLEDSATITVTLRDINENEVSPETAKAAADRIGLFFNKIGADAALGIPTALRYVEGTATYTATITSEVANVTELINYSWDGSEAAKAPVSLDYVAGEVNAKSSTISASPLEIEADGSIESIITVQLRDKFGNEVLYPGKNYHVQLIYAPDKFGDIQPADGVLVPSGSGKYTAKVTSERQGDDTFGFEILTDNLGKGNDTVTIFYKMGGISATESKIWVEEPKKISTNDGDRATIYVQLMDAKGNKPKDHEHEVFIFNSAGLKGQTILGSTLTDQFEYVNEGLYKLEIYSEVTGKDTLEFEYNRIGSTGSRIKASDSDVITYVAGDVDMTKSTIDINPEAIVADDQDRARVTVQLRDRFGNPILNNLGTVKIADLNIGELSTQENELIFQEGSGTYTAYITSTTSGIDKNVGFTLNGGEKSSKVKAITYTPGAVHLGNSTISVNPAIITADEIDKAIVTIQFKDYFENNIEADVPGTITLSGVKIGQAKDGSEVRSMGNGKYEIDVISRKIGTDKGIKAYIDRDRIAGNDTVDITYIAGEATVENSVIEAIPPLIEANDDEASTLTVQLRDKFNNNLDRETTKVVALDQSTLVSGKLAKEDGNYVFEYAGNGRYILSIKSEIVGHDYVNFMLDGQKRANGAARVDYALGSVSLVTSTISFDPPKIIADGSDKSTVTVQLKDASGNNLKDDDGRKEITIIGFDPEIGAKVTPTLLVHEAEGRYVGTITSKVSGTDILSYHVKDFGNGQKSEELTYVAGEYSLIESLIRIEPSTIKADGEHTARVTVQLRDANKNNILINDQKVSLLPLQYGTMKDDASLDLKSIGAGIYEGFIVSIIAGGEDVGFAVDGNEARNKQRLTYTPGDADLTQSLMSAAPIQIEANGLEKSIITVQLRDRYANNVDKKQGDVYLVKPSDAKGESDGSANDEFIYEEHGRYTIGITSKEAGSDTFHFRLDHTDAPEDINATIAYIAGGADTKNSTITATPTAITADGQERSKLTVQLRDGEGNSLANGINQDTGVDYVITLIPHEESNPIIGEVTNLQMQHVTDGQFVTYVTSTVADIDHFSFTIEGRKAESNTKVTYRAGKADSNTSVIRANPESIEVSDGRIVSILTVELRDAKENIVAPGNDKVEIVSASGVSIGTLSKTDQGTYQATVFSAKTGSEIFGFKLNDSNELAKDRASVSYTPGPYDLSQTTIDAKPDKIAADGKETSKIVIQLKDAFGNNLTTNAIGEARITGVLLAQQVATQPKPLASYTSGGRYEVELSSIKAGVETRIGFETLSGEKGQDFTSLTYLPGEADLAQSTISVDKSSLVADNSDQAVITVELRDSQGNRLQASQGDVKLIFNGAGGLPVGIPVPEAGVKIEDHNDGTYTATITSKVANKVDSINYSLDKKDGKGHEVSSSAPATIRYIAGDIDLEKTIITATPKVIEANGEEKSTITVQLRDAFDNNIQTRAPGDNIFLTRNTNIGDIENGGKLTFSSNGQYSTTVTSKVSDKETFGYTIEGLGDGQGPNGKVTITYQTGGMSLVRSEIDITPKTITANGEMESIITVQLLDQEGNKPKDNPGIVKLTGIILGDLKDSSGSDFEISHVAEGLYRGIITSKKIGIDKIGFTFNGNDAQAKKELAYTAGEVDLTKSTIAINPASITANGQARATVTVQLVDKFNNNIVENKGDIELILDIGKVNNSDSKVLSHTNGTYKGIITSTVAGFEEVGFKFVGQVDKADATAPITYTAGSMNLTHSTITVDPAEIEANDSDTSTITVQFKDVFDNNITEPIIGNVKLDIEGIQTGETVQDLTVVAGDNGKYIATVKSKIAGFDNIGFRVDENLGAGGKRETVTYLAGKADITKTRFTANPISILANDATTATLKVELFDAFDNKVNPQSQDKVEIIFKDSANALGQLEQLQRSVDGSFTARVKSQKAGIDEFDFILNNQAADYSDVSVTYTAGEANARMSEIKADPPSITADGVTKSTITVQLKDQFGNKLTKGIGAGAVVIAHTGERTGDEYLTNATDNNDGTYSTTITSKKVGQDTFGFMVLTVSGGVNNVASVTYTAGEASAAQSEISVSPAMITADGETEATITITLRDALGNRLSSNGNLTATDFELTGIDKGEIKKALTYVGGDSGRFIATVVSMQDGEDTIGFKLKGEQATGPRSTVVLEYRSGGYSLTTSTIELSKPEIVADEEDHSIVTVTLRDQYRNIVTEPHIVQLVGLEVGHLEKEGSLVLLSENGNGIYTGIISSRKTGSDDNIRFAVVEDGKSNVSHDFKSLKYVAGKASIKTSIISVQPPIITADNNDTATVSVQFRDKFGNNLDREVVETVTLDKDSLKYGESVTGALEKAYVGGGRYILEIKSKKAGVDTLGYFLGTERGEGNATLTYIAGAVSLEESTITVNPDKIVADGVTQSEVTVQFVDAFGNKLTTNAGYVTLNVTGMIGNLDNGRMEYQRGQGAYVGYITSEKSGVDTISYTIEGVGLGEKTAKLTYIPGVVDLKETTIIASPSTIKADGEQTSDITIQLRDAKGNIVPDQVGTVELLDVKFGYIYKEPEYIDNGRYEAEVRSTTAETDIIGYQLSTESEAGQNRASVTYTPGDYDLEFSTINADPTSIEANGTTRSKITVQLKDSHSNNVSGNPTDVYVTGIMNGNFNDEKEYRFVPEGDGRYVGYVTSIKAGEDTIGFTAGGNVAKGKTTTVSYYAGDMDPTISTITATPKEILANGVEVSTIKVQLKDSNGNNLTSGINSKTNQPYKVVLVPDSIPSIGIVEPATLEMQNNQDGTFIAKVTSIVPGSETFGFKVDGEQGALKETITYTNGNGDFDQGKSSITTNPKEINADGQSTSTVTVTLFHTGTDQPLTGLTSSELNIITADGQPMIGQLGPMSEVKGTGIYTYTVTSTKVLGTDTLTFETSADRYQGNDTIKYSAGKGEFDQAKSKLEINPLELNADGKSTAKVMITLFYKDTDVPLSGLSNTELTLVTSGGAEWVGTPGLLTEIGDSGVYEGVITATTNRGVDSVTFKTEADQYLKPQEVTYSAGNGEFDQESSIITADPREIDADGQMISTVTVKMYYDQAGQKPLTGYEGLELVSKDGKAIVGNVIYIDEIAEGIYTFEVTSKTVGEDNFAFKTKAKTSDKSVIVKYVAGGTFDEDKSSIVAVPEVIDADGIEQSKVTVKLFYKNGLPIEGHTPQTLSLVTDGESLGIVVAAGIFESAPGVYEFDVTSVVEGKDIWKFKTNQQMSLKSVGIEYLHTEDALLLVRLTASNAQAKVGDIVLMTVNVKNIGNVLAKPFNIVNSLPGGFSYVANSAKAESKDGMTITGNSPLDLGNLELAAGGEVNIRFVVRVGAGVKPGNNTFYTEAFMKKMVATRAVEERTISISNRASVVLNVDDSDPLFDDSLIIGTVYHDRNGNGIQDPGEPGIPGVRIVSAEGLIITTDQFGRYHLKDIKGGKWERGRNYILKIDEASLPEGVTFVTSNPLVRRITPGLPTRFDFALQLPEESIIEVSEVLFMKGKARIKPEFEQYLTQMIELIEENDIKEITISTLELGTLSEEREEYLQKLLNRKLNDENRIIVGSEFQEAEGK